MRVRRYGMLASLALAALAVGGSVTAAAAAPRGESRSAERLIWQQRLEEADLELLQAHERLAAARAAHARALPGAASAAGLVQDAALEVERAEELLTDAEHRHRELLQRARRVGVPEAWLAPVSAPVPAASGE